MNFLGQYTAYFTIPWTEADGKWSRWYNTTGRRGIFVRPQGDNQHSSAYLVITSSSQELASAAASNDPVAQKELFQQLFADAGWEASRVLADMKNADDFYM